ncbi:MAG: B12-binding domain-containing protein [Candidatus Thorarchaeota archaeon]
MHPFYETFLKFLDNENKQKCVEFIISKLDSKEIDIPTLYSEILEPAFNLFYCDSEDGKLCIWKEHIRTSIIRTIIEICYPYIIKEKREKGLKQNQIKVFVGCPAEEHYDIGAKMIADLFTFYGCEAIYVGADIPRTEIRDAINILKPNIIALCVTNYYNLVEAEKAISLIREYTDFDGKIIVGGLAFLNNPEIFKKIGADFFLENYNDIQKLVEEV